MRVRMVVDLHHLFPRPVVQLPITPVLSTFLDSRLVSDVSHWIPSGARCYCQSLNTTEALMVHLSLAILRPWA